MTFPRAIRILLALVCLCFVIWAFVAVGARSYRLHRDKTQRPIVLTILHWGDPAENNIVQSLVDRYMAENPRVRVERIHTPDLRTKVKTMLAAGTPPDLFYLPPDMMPELANLHLIRPIDDYVDREVATTYSTTQPSLESPKRDWAAMAAARTPVSAEALLNDPQYQYRNGQEWLDDFWPVLLRAYRYDVVSGRVGEGKLYGLPKDFTTPVAYVNLDLFEAAGARVPYDGWTWDEYAETCKKITALSNDPRFAGRKIYGGHFTGWPDVIQQIFWSFGGDFFGKSPDDLPKNFRDVGLKYEAAQEALSFIVRARIAERFAFNTTGIGKDGGEEYFTGNIGVIGPYGRWMTPRYRDIKNFRWDVVPFPQKNADTNAKFIFHNAWTISAGCEHPDEAFKLMKFLCGRDGQVLQSKLGLAIPALQSVAYSDAFLDGKAPKNTPLFLSEVSNARVQQLPRDVGYWNTMFEQQIARCIQLAKVTPPEMAEIIEKNWLGKLNSPLQKQHPPVNWRRVITIACAGVAILLAALLFAARRQKLGPLDAAQERAGFGFILPWLIGFAVLTVGPMIVSLVLSFTKWTGLTPMASAEMVGATNYTQLFTADATFLRSLKVTLYYTALAVPVTQIAALAVAMLMNVKVSGIGVFRTIYFIPAVISGVAMAVMWWAVFNNEYGLVNELLRPVFGLFNRTPPDWFGTDVQAWGIPAFVIMATWTVGGGMIIYLAGLKGIPASLYEAATIDGAGAWRKFVTVTLPMLSPLIFFNVVMGIIASFQVFLQAMVMTEGGPDNHTLFYVLNLYQNAFKFHQMGYASAMAWVLFVICLLLTIGVFRGSKGLVYYEGLKA